jgi:dTDP-4-dehydrorhamnose reductase
MKTKLLLFGANGQVGWELQRALAPLGHLLTLTRAQVDLTNSEAIRKTIQETKPNYIINAAAYTAVDKAERESDLAYAINAEAVGIMAEAAKEIGSWLIHYSTDYVFDGDKQSYYCEADPVAPLSVYGKTKLAGEEKIKSVGGQYLIFRTTWVYATRGHNFAKTMLRLAKERDQLRIISDQRGVPTSAELIADVTALCITRLQLDAGLGQKATGIYHLTAAGETNWHEYACFVLNLAQQQGQALRVNINEVIPIPTSEYPTPAQRPLNSCLNTQKLQNTFNIYLPDWRVHVTRMMYEILN